MMVDTLYCSFCRKSHLEVAKLIAGPTVHICNECTDLCHDIIHPAEAAAAAPPTVDIDALDNKLVEIRTIVLTVESRIASLRHKIKHPGCRPPAAFARAGSPAEIIGFSEALDGEERRWPDNIEDAFAGDEDGRFEWTVLSARETGLNFEIWVCDIKPIVAVTAHRFMPRDELNKLYRWLRLNAEALADAQSGKIDTKGLVDRLQRLP